SDGYQGYDAFLATPHDWDDGSVGNYWTAESMENNGGKPLEYWVGPFPPWNQVKDTDPSYSVFQEAGPR
ncbi:MAG: hypothetical protein ACE5KV_08000, partial [Thermoplasmata archaeon]